jgi:hypothetical protein
MKRPSGPRRYSSKLTFFIHIPTRFTTNYLKYPRFAAYLIVNHINIRQSTLNFCCLTPTLIYSATFVKSYSHSTEPGSM